MEDFYKIRNKQSESKISKCKHFIGDCCNPYQLVISGGAGVIGYGLGYFSSFETDVANYFFNTIKSTVDGNFDPSFSFETSRQIAHEVGLRSMAVYSSITYFLFGKLRKKFESLFKKNDGGSHG